MEANRLTPTPEQRARYEAQLQLMLRNARRWLAANPRATPAIVFPHPKAIAFIGTWSDGVKVGVAQPNEDAQRLVAAMHDGIEKRLEGTILMVRTIFDAALKGR